VAILVMALVLAETGFWDWVARTIQGLHKHKDN
jgi:hypothetical protein